MTDQPKHTPAPWTIQEYGDDDAPALVIHKGETENRVCFMATPGSYGDPAIIEADAHLIAAAPDMLAALKAVVTMRDRGAFEAARAAIAKATGGSSNDHRKA